MRRRNAEQEPHKKVAPPPGETVAYHAKVARLTNTFKKCRKECRFFRYFFHFFPMALLEGFWIKNFRMLKQFAIGSCYLQFVYVDEDISQQKKYELSPISVLIGRNGTGKSAVLDSFAFIHDCMQLGVEDACVKRGGFDSLYSQGASGPLSFGYNFRLTPHSKVLTYVVNIDFGVGNRPYVETELLAYRADSAESFGMPILFFQNGEKIVRHLMTNGKISDEMSRVERTDMRRLGIASLGDLRDYPVVGDVKKFFANCYFANASTENQRAFTNPSAVPANLSVRGEGVASLLRYYLKEYPLKFQSILNRIATKIPDVEMIDVDKGRQGRLTLSVKKRKFPAPFYGHQLSEGFLKHLAYYLLLDEPTPAPFVGIEEPENGLDYRLLKSYIKDVHAATHGMGCSQFLFTTHSPSLADWMEPEDVWILESSGDGFTRVQRGSDYPIIQEMIKNDQPVGDSWFSDFYDQTWRESL